MASSTTRSFPGITHYGHLLHDRDRISSGQASDKGLRVVEGDLTCGWRADVPGATAAGRDPAELDLTVSVGVEFTDGVEAAGRRHAEGYAFTFGAMGSATTNCYNDAFERQGYGDDVRAVKQLWLAGDHDAARRRVPTTIGLGTNLIGTDDIIRERLRRYRDAGITTLRAQLQGDPATDLDRQLTDLARLLELLGEVNRDAQQHVISHNP